MFQKKNNHLREIIETLAEGGVDFLVCGGVALVIHGVERMTLDLDLSVGMERDNLVRFLHVMKKLGLVPRVPVPADSLLDPDKRREMVSEKNALVFPFFDPKNPYRQVDIFIADSFSHDMLKNHVETMKIGNTEVRLLTKEKLLDMKKAIKPPRDKDLFDIKALEDIMKRNGRGQ
ncbi:MAG TPA: hypothetical protein PK307_13880 [Spirochaetota bacterium]|nr:hypothetical protein [Spirochaetota bacterium]HOD16918.1 hypothetical protein [Spirochaetota bacterium]HPN11089.1 hypothetical protein [Spirochaetota bacterium]HQL83289.1 hypothetical protein [Spirochaetota bacterium]